MSSTIYIIYNADSSVLGKLKYAHTKLMQSSSDESPCSACDLTHNGLHLTETSQWSATKKRIHGADIKQLHRDELSAEVKECVAEEKLDLPVVLGRGSQEGRLLVLIPKGELAACSKDHEKFLAILQKTAGEQSIPLEIQGKAE